MSLADAHPELPSTPSGVPRGPLAFWSAPAARRLSALAPKARRPGEPGPEGARADGQAAAADPRAVAVVCAGASCVERGGAELVDALRAADAEAIIATVACLQSCATGPNCALGGVGPLHTGQTSERVPELLRELRSAERCDSPSQAQDPIR